MPQRSAAVIGATGLVGRHLVSTLIADPTYTKVVVLARRGLAVSHDKLEARLVDFDELDKHELDVDDAFSALGTTIKQAGSKAAFRKVDFDFNLAFARAARRSADQLLLVSALGASDKSRIFYNRVKGELEEAVRALGFGGTHVFRPSFLAGDRDEKRVGERAGIFAARVLATVLPIGPVRRARPIEASDVAGAMVSVAKRDERGFFVHESERIQAIADSSGRSN